MNNFWSKPNRFVVLGLSVVVAVSCVYLLSIFLDREGMIATVLLDMQNFPWSIQNALHILFFIGLGELFIRWRSSVLERAHLSKGYLPENIAGKDALLLQSHTLGDIRRKVFDKYDGENGVFPFLIDQCILQFRTTNSIAQAASIMNSNLELISHRLDLNYSMIRYIIWLIPTVGFIGTVVGISWTLNLVNPDDVDLKILTASLAVAFNTTLVALILSAILVFLLHIVQSQEEKIVNLAGHNCLTNLVNRLYKG